MTQMSTISRLFAAWATDFKHDPFFKARCKLAASYTLGIMVILLVFNVTVYELYGSTFFDTPEEILADQNKSEEVKLLEQDQDKRSLYHLKEVLYLANVLTTLFVASLSYYLAWRTLKPIADSFERQKKFIADAAHELRTPLTVMKTGIEATAHSAPGLLEYKNLSDELLEEINHLSALTDDLLFLAKNDTLEALKQPTFEKIDLGEVAEKQLFQMQAYAEKKGIIFRADIDQYCLVRGNVIYLKRLLSNLMQNAVEYNIPNGEIFVTLKKNNHRVVLTVRDTGIGISEENQARVFERFYKGDEARTSRSGGAGLGLSIVQEIVRLHKGTIDVESKVSVGTTFRVILPSA